MKQLSVVRKQYADMNNALITIEEIIQLKQNIKKLKLQRKKKTGTTSVRNWNVTGYEREWEGDR